MLKSCYIVGLIVMNMQDIRDLADGCAADGCKDHDKGH